MSSTQIAELIDLARAQLPYPGDWSLATNAGWLQEMYLEPGVVSHFWRDASGAFRGSASVRLSQSEPAAVSVTSMIRPDALGIWDEQRRWMEAALQDMPVGLPAHAVCESLSDDEVARWRSAGYDLTFEELVMEFATTRGSPVEPPRWPQGTTLSEWSSATAVASSEVWQAAFRERPGFPGWTPAEWIERQTGGGDFLPEASLLASIDGVAAGFVISGDGWIGQVGVAPAFRRRGLAAAIVTEALHRQRALGHDLVHLHVNTNNSGAMATWRGLGFEPVGRRGRFERAEFDYHGALVVVETGAGEIVFIHPHGAPPEAPASLPSNPCEPGESQEAGAVRMVREMTGLDVVIVREFVTFIQPGTPTGTMNAHGYIARVTGGSLIEDGPEGPARASPLSALPTITPIRVANRRTLEAYLEQRARGDG